MASRQRQSTAALTQTLELPPYEAPLHALNAGQQRKLQEIGKNDSLKKLEEHLQHSNVCITNVAGDINERLVTRKTKLRQRKAQPSQEETEWEEQDRELEEMENRVDRLTQRMEETVRKIIDTRELVTYMKNGLGDVQAQASIDAAQATQYTTQRNLRSTADNEDEEIPDFDPTDPASTGPRASALSTLFTRKLENDKTRWQTLAQYTRYANNEDYAGFRTLVHEAQHGEDDATEPDKRTWFSDGPGSPAPGISRRGRADAGSDSDTSDIAVARERISTRCPVTLREYEDPITSKKCPHTFEKEAILEMIHNNIRARRGPIQCPVSGCQQMLAEADLAKKPLLERKIKKIQAARKRAAEDRDSDDENQGGNVIEEIGSDDDNDAMDGIEASRARSVRPKAEPRSSRPPQATADIISMSGSETEDE
ncbi:MAG: hypothetical protein M1820_001465 [Bogoriella megaspora]|nr:MAG: hypothetical protein M1820_001465 [Bogoriella megaspora]